MVNVTITANEAAIYHNGFFNDYLWPFHRDKPTMKINGCQIVFVGGIHGVGKTVFSQKACNVLNIPHLNASTLISEQRNNAPAAVNKRVQDVAENQNALIAAITSHSKNLKQLLLDGHFCVLDVSDTINRIPIGTFRALPLVGVIVLIGEVTTVVERLQNREKKSHSFELLERLQASEVDHAKSVCDELNVPCFIASESDHNNALDFVNHQLGKRR